MLCLPRVKLGIGLEKVIDSLLSVGLDFAAPLIKVLSCLSSPSEYKSTPVRCGSLPIER
jgi:hypothetical protein